jgi:tetratricopeptide (TPR) repeat protein
MKLPKYAIIIILTFLFIAAVILRSESGQGSGYLYFDGTSGTNYRYAYQIGQNGTPVAVDQKAVWPEGISITSSKPLGAEYVAGYSHRLIKYFSETEERALVRRLTSIFSSLLVFTLFGISYTLWRSQAGALFTAFLAAFFQPLVKATDGSTFLHIHFAVVILSIHVLSFLRCRQALSWLHAVLAAFSSFALLAVWEPAAYYLAFFAILYTLWPGGEPAKKRVFIALQLAAFLAASNFQPYLSAHRIAFSLPAACIYSAAIYTFIANLLPFRRKTSLAGILCVIAGAMILTLILKPLRSGGLAPFPTLEYFFFRLRYLFGKPSDPLSLSDAIRFAWTSDHAAPSRYSMFHAIFPLAVILPAVISAAVSLKKRTRNLAERSNETLHSAAGNSMPILPVSLVALISVAWFSADRSTLVLAMPAIFPLLGLPFRGLREHLLTRGLFILIGFVLIVPQTIAPHGRFDLVRHAALRTNFEQERVGDFLNISIGDADQNLVRFLIRRTSVRDPMLAPPDISSVLATFAGRTTILAPGIETQAMIDKTVSFVDTYYEDESELYAACRETGIEYVVYSADIVLDASKYSPLYLAGRNQLPPSSIAYKMHFFPEMLRHFTLTYENDNYRLFKVSDTIQPIFTTDHPPIYQYEILNLNGDSLELFYQRIVNLVLLYGSARDEQIKGNHSAALDIYNRCIEQAPHYTAARLGQAGSFSSLGEYMKAKEAYQTVISYAPDNPQALYGISLSLARLGETDRAKQYVAILLSSIGDEEIIKKAKLLKWFLDEDIPVESPDSLPAGSE